MVKRMLPNGSVVLLNEATHKVMICGRLQVDGEGNRYDYCACLYPEGYLGGDQLILFNESDIAKLYYVGLQDEEEIIYQAALHETFGDMLDEDEDED